jgi:porin
MGSCWERAQFIAKQKQSADSAAASWSSRVASMHNKCFARQTRRGCRIAGLLAGLASLISWVRTANATPPSIAVPSEFTSSTNQPSAVSGFLGDLLKRNYLLGDIWGLREDLSKYGVSVYGLQTSEILGNVSGGVRQAFDYDGLTQMVLQLDTQRAFGLYGGTFNVSGLLIRGENLSAENLHNLQTASGIEADRSSRLWELWYQQKFLEEDRLDVKIGQQSLDQEFMVSQNALLFVNTMFGWPMLPSADMPGGGPAYPLSALGVRVRARPVNALSFLAGVFNGSPVANNTGDPQQQNPSGTSFPLNGGALVISELQYAYPSIGSMVYSSQSQVLSGIYKIGFWYDTESFADQQYDNTGLSLANPASTGVPREHYGNYAVYGVVDQWLWSDPHDENGDRGLDGFVRVMGTPESDRNLISFSMNAGLTFHEPIYHRDADTCGLGMGYAKVSDRAAALDQDTGFFTHTAYPVRGGEVFVEATYQFQATAWLQIQPDFQYIFNPGGGIPNPTQSTERVKNEAILGLRINVLF